MHCLAHAPVLSNARPTAASSHLLPQRSRNSTYVHLVGALHNKVVPRGGLGHGHEVGRDSTRLRWAEPRAPCLSVEHESAAVELDHGLTWQFPRP